MGSSLKQKFGDVVASQEIDSVVRNLEGIFLQFEERIKRIKSL